MYYSNLGLEFFQDVQLVFQQDVEQSLRCSACFFGDTFELLFKTRLKVAGQSNFVFGDEKLAATPPLEKSY